MRRATRWVAATTVASMAVAGLSVVAARRLTSTTPAPARTPAAGAPLLASPPPQRPLVSPSEAALGPVVTTAGVARAVDPHFADRLLGPRVSAVVVDAATRQVVYARNPTLLVKPASTAKIATAVAALDVLGAQRRLVTRAVVAGTVAEGTLTGRLVLVGAGDPTLASPKGAARLRYPKAARLSDLADAVVRAGVRRVTGAVAVDGSLFAGPLVAPGWKPNYLTEGSVARVGALMVDGGRLEPGESDRYREPDLAAGRLLRDLLRSRGVTVPEAVVRHRAAPAAQELARVESPTVGALVERMLSASDNNLAEALARLVAIERAQPPTFAGAARAVASALAGLGVRSDAVSLTDGSGLSTVNRATTTGLAQLLLAAVDPGRGDLRRVVTGLPVAGFDGTLSERYDELPASLAAGIVRAKTGSLDNVSTLAGVVRARSGRLLVFAFSADQLPTKSAGPGAGVLDRAAAALAACGCTG